MAAVLTIVSDLGSLAKLTNGGTLTIKGGVAINIKSKGAIICNNNAKVNIIDIQYLKVNGGTAIQGMANSSINIASIDTLQADSGAILSLTNSNAIITDVKNLISDATSITSIGKSKLLLNNISAITCKSSEVFITANSSLNGGTITLRNIPFISKTLNITDHNLVLDISEYLQI